MTLYKPYNEKRTKFCFVYCGPDKCDCMPRGGMHEPYIPPTPPLEIVPEKEPTKTGLCNPPCPEHLCREWSHQGWCEYTNPPAPLPGIHNE